MGLLEERAELIKDGKFKLSHFKKFYEKMQWTRVPRQLGPKHSAFFYYGKYEDEFKIINIRIRPTMFMVVEETVKGCDKNGNKVAPNYKGPTFEFGTTVEVQIDEAFLKKIKDLAKPEISNSIQKVSW